MQFSRIAAAAGVAILIQILPAGAEDMTVADEIKAARIALDQAFQKHDRAAIQKMVTADHLAVTTYYGKPFTTADELAGEAWEKLVALMRHFADPATGFLSRRMPFREGESGDYDHLARVREWASASEGDEA